MITPTPDMKTWNSIASELGVAKGTLYAICRTHPEVHPMPSLVVRKVFYFSPEEANRFIDWYRKTRLQPLELADRIESDEVVVGYEGVLEYTLELTGGRKGMSINNAGYWQRKIKKKIKEGRVDPNTPHLQPDFALPGPNGGRPKSHFLKSSIRAFLDSIGWLQDKKKAPAEPTVVEKLPKHRRVTIGVNLAEDAANQHVRAFVHH